MSGYNGQRFNNESLMWEHRPPWETLERPLTPAPMTVNCSGTIGSITDFIIPTEPRDKSCYGCGAPAVYYQPCSYCKRINR